MNEPPTTSNPPSSRTAKKSAALSPAELYAKLHEAHGHRGWWPAKTEFEICVGAILTQNVSWRNVEQAIRNLAAANALGPKKMLALDEERLAELIRPSGYFRVKAQRLRAFLEHLRKHHRSSVTRLLAQESEPLRTELLSIPGIGRETADCMLCYAAGHPIFVVDAYTRRLAYRLGWFPDESTDYEVLREYVESRLAGWDAERLGDVHAQIVHHASRTCTKRTPTCGDCPVAAQCPTYPRSARAQSA